jgi:hydroxypyruvate reductase
VSAAIAAADPARLVSASLARALPAESRVSLLAVGKGAGPMALACVGQAASRIHRALVIAPDLPRNRAGLRWMEGSHPVPDGRSVAAGREALALAEEIGMGETLLVLLSGGASALMALPAAGLTLEAKQAATRRLLAANATIDEVNCVRKHLSAVKGGRLAAASRGAVVTLALSDVVGDDPSVIGSGPTVPDPSTFGEALAIVERCGGDAAFPGEVVERLRRGSAGEIPETPKPGHAAFEGTRYEVIGSGAGAARGAAEAATQAGYRVVVLDEPIVGESRVAALAWLARIRTLAAEHRGRFCVVSRGETTVDVRGTGRGGRNQEFALALASALGGLGREAVVASVGTDGIDGPTDAAGALADSGTAARAAQLALDPMRYLESNDAWSFFDALGDLVRTGPTGTNVGDVQIAVLGPKGPGS